MAVANPDAVVLELMTMGLQSAAHLEALLRAASPAPSPHRELASEILRCCGRVIAALSATGGKKRKAVEHDSAQAAACSPPAMPPRKRCRGEQARRVVTGSATTTEDGFIWRKYGQKDINGRRHPRLYYRCAYKDQGCAATQRVQQTHDAPAAFEIAYYGDHTCSSAACQDAAAALPPPAVVDFGSNAWASAGGAWSAPAAASLEAEHRPWSWDGEVSQSQGGWSSSSASSEAGFEAQTAHDTARAAEQATGYAPDPVTEFLDGCFDWASVVNHPFEFGALLQ